MSTIPTQLVLVGDSNTKRQYPSTIVPYGEPLADLLGLTYGTDVVNLGYSGTGTHALPDIDYLWDPAKTDHHAVVMIGTNNIYNPTTTPAIVLSDALTLVAEVKAWMAKQKRSWTFSFCSLIGSDKYIPDVATLSQLHSINREFRAALAASGLNHIDVGDDPDVGSNAAVQGTGDYFDDEVHASDLGTTRIADIVASGSEVRKSFACGIERTEDLTIWNRADAVQVNELGEECFEMADLNAIDRWHNHFVENNQADPTSGHVPILRSKDGWEPGIDCLVFPGLSITPGPTNDKTAFMSAIKEDVTTVKISDVTNADEFMVNVVCEVTNVLSTNSTPYADDGLAGDPGTGNGPGMSLTLQKVGSDYFARLYLGEGNFDKVIDAQIPLGEKLLISGRLKSGKLGIRVVRLKERDDWRLDLNPWIELSGTVGDMTERNGTVYIGYTAFNVFNGKFREQWYRKSAADALYASDCAYIRAAYGP